jgi:DNA-binding NarL/FixJ family response regulator
VEGLQRILRGCPEISPAMARCLLENLRPSGRTPAIVEQTLDSLGKGSSLKEAARALGLRVEDVHANVAQAFALMRQSEQPN